MMIAAAAIGTLFGAPEANAAPVTYDVHIKADPIGGFSGRFEVNGTFTGDAGDDGILSLSELTALDWTVTGELSPLPKVLTLAALLSNPNSLFSFNLDDPTEILINRAGGSSGIAGFWCSDGAGNPNCALGKRLSIIAAISANDFVGNTAIVTEFSVTRQGGGELPEPGTWALVAVAAAVLRATRRRTI